MGIFKRGRSRATSYRWAAIVDGMAGATISGYGVMHRYKRDNQSAVLARSMNLGVPLKQVREEELAERRMGRLVMCALVLSSMGMGVLTLFVPAAGGGASVCFFAAAAVGWYAMQWFGRPLARHLRG